MMDNVFSRIKANNVTSTYLLILVSIDHVCILIIARGDDYHSFNNIVIVLETCGRFVVL